MNDPRMCDYHAQQAAEFERNLKRFNSKEQSAETYAFSEEVRKCKKCGMVE